MSHFFPFYLSKFDLILLDPKFLSIKINLKQMSGIHETWFISNLNSLYVKQKKNKKSENRNWKWKNVFTSIGIGNMMEFESFFGLFSLCVHLINLKSFNLIKYQKRTKEIEKHEKWIIKTENNKINANCYFGSCAGV